MFAWNVISAAFLFPVLLQIPATEIRFQPTLDYSCLILTLHMDTNSHILAHATLVGVLIFNFLFVLIFHLGILSNRWWAYESLLNFYKSEVSIA